MKNILKTLALSAVVAFFTLSFTTGEDKKEIKTDKSKVTWKGYKVTGSHEGTIDIKSGSLTFVDTKLVGGEFVIDMTSINTTDLDGGMKGKLDGHLKSDDFFGVANHPTATLVFNKVKPSKDVKGSYHVEGDLTIKGKTHLVDFDMVIEGNKAKAALKINRAKYDVRYGSKSFFDNLKDKAIDDEFDLVTELEF